MAKIMCGCTGNKDGKEGAAFQDAAYGKGVRIATESVSGDGKRTVYRCTVCSKETDRAINEKAA
jgi:hypothetical protein